MLNKCNTERLQGLNTIQSEVIITCAVNAEVGKNKNNENHTKKRVKIAFILSNCKYLFIY